MRILFLVHQFLPEYAGGTERVTLALARAAQSAGAQVEIFTASLNGGEGWRSGPGGLLSRLVEGIPVFAVPPVEPAEPLQDLGFRPRADTRRLFEAFLDARPRFDLAHVTHSMRLLDAVEVLAQRRLRYMATLTDFLPICHRINLVRLDGTSCDGPRGGQACQAHCWALEIGEAEFGERLSRYGAVLREAEVVVAVSEFVAARVRSEHPELAVRVIPNGVDLLRFPRPQPRPAGGRRVFGYLGTVSEAKGAELLVRAFVRAARKDASLRIVGPCYETELASRIAEAGRGFDVRLEPPVPADEVGRRLAEFDVLCVPSQVPESFCLSLHEGFGAGLPALVADHGNAGAVVRQHGCGLALPPGDVEAWAAAIGRACDEPQMLETWRAATPLPMRVEEEGFVYHQLYRAIAGARAPAAPG